MEKELRAKSTYNRVPDRLQAPRSLHVGEEEAYRYSLQRTDEDFMNDFDNYLRNERD